MFAGQFSRIAFAFLVSFYLLPTNFAVLCQAQNWKLRREYQPKNLRSSLNCSTKFTNEIIQLIIDYAQWRNVALLYIVDKSVNSVCNMKAIRRSLDCFLSNDISISLQKKFRRHVYTYHKAKRVLVVSFLQAKEMDYDSYLEQVNTISRTDGYYLWLNIYQGYNSSVKVERHALDILRSSEINLAVDMVIAVEMSKSAPVESPEVLICKRKDQALSVGLEKKHVETILPFNRSSKTNNSSQRDYFEEYCKASSSFSDISYCFLQVYKIRKTENVSMVVRPLGQWQYASGTQTLKPFQSIEARKDLMGYSLIFGKKKLIQETTAADENIEDDNDEQNMDKILELITDHLNATAEVKLYPILGAKSTTGNWSGLLGAVVHQEVDVALDSVIKVPERYNDMSFTQDIMISIRNIYLKPEESHTARDIYLQPFKPKLLLCVLATGVIFATVMSIYITSFHKREPKKHKHGSHYTAISDAVLWSFSVISMQGSTVVHSQSYSGNLIIVVSLLFAVIIYNSYSAFITSILSFKLTEIRSVNDLLESDYDIGYTKNSQDEVFLRSMNNESQLNQIYLRGYLHNNINNVTDGLLKATEGNYGFFVTGHIARKQILKISGYKCRFDILEIPVKSTRHSVAFPVSRNSPYRKLINMCLIKMTETGIHDYIGFLIKPNLPKCDKPQTYQSARINDLSTSFILLGIGIILGIVIMILETLWKNKEGVYAKLKARHRRLNNLNQNNFNPNTLNLNTKYPHNFNSNGFNPNTLNPNVFKTNSFKPNTYNQWIQ